MGIDLWHYTLFKGCIYGVELVQVAIKKEDILMQALFTLTPAESKRLIARGIVSIPEIQQAREEGYLMVGRGSTNAYIVEELLGKIHREGKNMFAGQVIKGITCALLQGVRLQPVTFYKNQLLDVDPSTVIDELGTGDILLKGANAVDHTGRVGVIMANPMGGTMGPILPAHEGSRSNYYLSRRSRKDDYLCRRSIPGWRAVYYRTEHRCPCRNGVRYRWHGLYRAGCPGRAL